jgi:23S rRNA pseudoU1915 N3-methylase RlmH
MAFWNDPTNLIPKQKHRWVISFGDRNNDVTDKRTKFNGAADSLDDNTMHVFLAKSVDRPSYTIKTVSAKYLYSHTFKFPTRPVWNPITVTFYDAQVADDVRTYLQNPRIDSTDGSKITNTFQGDKDDSKSLFKQSTQFFFYDFLRKAGYYDPEEYDSDDQLLRFRTYNFKRNMIESLVGTSGSNVEYRTGNGGNLETINTLGFANKIQITEFTPDGSGLERWSIYNPLITDVKFDKLDYSTDDIPLITVTIEYDWAALEPLTPTVSNVEEEVKKVTDAMEKGKQALETKIKQIKGASLGGKFGDDQEFTLQDAERQIRDELYKQQQAIDAAGKNLIPELQSVIEEDKKQLGQGFDTNLAQIKSGLQEKAIKALEDKVLRQVGDNLQGKTFKESLDVYNNSLAQLSQKGLEDYAKKTGIDLKDLQRQTKDELDFLTSGKSGVSDALKAQNELDRAAKLIGYFKNISDSTVSGINRTTTTQGQKSAGAFAAFKALDDALKDKKYLGQLTQSEIVLLGKEKDKYKSIIDGSLVSRIPEITVLGKSTETYEIPSQKVDIFYDTTNSTPRTPIDGLSQGYAAIATEKTETTQVPSIYSADPSGGRRYQLIQGYRSVINFASKELENKDLTEAQEQKIREEQAKYITLLNRTLYDSFVSKQNETPPYLDELLTNLSGK